MMNEQNKKLEKYLAQLDSYLRYKPVFEKTDILCELKNTIYERLNNGQSEESIIAELGTPKELALSYMDESSIKNNSFSFKRFAAVSEYYSFACIIWIVIIPVLSVLSISFYFSSAVSIFAGIMALLKGFLHFPFLDNFKFMFFLYELKGIPGLLTGILLAILFFGLGIIFWKAMRQTITFIKVQKWKLNNKGN